MLFSQQSTIVNHNRASMTRDLQLKCHFVLIGSLYLTHLSPPFSALCAHCACAALSHAAPLSWRRRRRSGLGPDSGRDGAVKWVTAETSLQQFPQGARGLSSLWRTHRGSMSDVPCFIFCSFLRLVLIGTSTCAESLHHRSFLFDKQSQTLKWHFCLNVFPLLVRRRLASFGFLICAHHNAISSFFCQV